MSPKIRYEVIDENRKTIRIGCGNNDCTFKLKIKRAFDVLVKMLEVYPRPMDIHRHLDEKFNDPNRAYNDLKNEEGYEPYIRESKNPNKSMLLTLDVEKLCKYCSSIGGSPIYLGVSDQRSSLSVQDRRTVFDKQHGLCNIMQIPLREKSSMNSETFAKNLKTLNYDHRIPQCRGGGECS